MATITDWVYLPADDSDDPMHYYANLTTGESQWDRPRVLELANCGSASTAGKTTCPVSVVAKWVEFMDEHHGRPYLYNTETGESVWVLPADEDKDDPQCEEEAPAVKVDEAARSEVEKAHAKTEKRAAHRLKLLKEIVNTEKSYVDSLRALNKVYVDPLRMVADVPKGAIFTHKDLDIIFLNITVIIKVNEAFLGELLEEEKKWPNVNYAPILKKAATKFKGCYTRYVNNFDKAAGTLLTIGTSDKPADKDKLRYLVGSARHPDAKGRDLRSFLIQPVQRVPRYRMLLDELLNHTDEDHAERADIQEALETVITLAKSFNEDKRAAEDHAILKEVFEKFCDKDARDLKAELNSFERKFIKEGSLVKQRLSHRQRRQLFLFSDILLYAEAGVACKGFKLKGKIQLLDGTRVESLPSTEDSPHAFALVENGGKGYTWLAESAAEKDDWFQAIDGAIRVERKAADLDASDASDLISMVKSKRLHERIAVLQGGSTLVKYNNSDGKSTPRWVCVTLDKFGAAELIRWGDSRTQDCKSEKRLTEATALLHGAKSSTFFKQKGVKADQDWQCFSLVFKDRTLDFAAANVGLLLDWYLALGALLPHSTEQILDEEQLRARISSQM